MSFGPALLLGLVGWIAIGVLLVWLQKRPKGRPEYRRTLSAAVCARGETVSVSLTHRVPVDIPPAADHDVILLLDRSSSMGSAPGSPLREMTRAAENFIKVLPNSFNIAVIAFDTRAEVLCPPTEDHGKARRAVAAIGPGGGTSIASALHAAAETLKGDLRPCRKTVILFSDGSDEIEATREAARDLSRHTILCAGFGAVNRQLLDAVAGASERVHVVDNSERLGDLFAFLAAEVGGHKPLAGVVEEVVRSPSPLTIMGTGEVHPIRGDIGDIARLTWAFPVLETVPPQLTYTIRPECCGWLAITDRTSQVTWQMPDGQAKPIPAPGAPRLLVLPPWLVWTWCLINPLAMLMFGRLFPCDRPKRMEETPPPPSPARLDFVVPEAPPPPADLPESPAPLSPALVIGFGDLGESMLATLRSRIRQSGAPAEDVRLLAIRLGAGLGTLAADETVVIDMDLRPYLEGLRDQGAPSQRAWVSYRTWLRRASPATTSGGAWGDRAMARLALLLAPEETERRIREALAEQPSRRVILIGGSDDAETTGLLAETAHVCATLGHSASVVLAAPSPEASGGAAALAFAHELKRLLLLQGDDVISDRGGQPKRARRLIDRVLFAGDPRMPVEHRIDQAVDLAWGCLAWKGLFERTPTTTEGSVQVATAHAVVLPMDGLWQWARARLLADVVERWFAPRPADTTGRTAANRFWSGEGVSTPRPSFIVGIAPVVESGDSATNFLVSTLAVLSNQLYAAQSAYCARERDHFAAYVETWCNTELADDDVSRGFPLVEIETAIVSIAEGLTEVGAALGAFSGQPGLERSTEIAVALCHDFALMMESLADVVASLVQRWVGDSGQPGAALPLRDFLKAEPQRVEAALIPTLPEKAIGEVRKAYGNWRSGLEDYLRRHLRFQVRRRQDDVPGRPIAFDVLMPGAGNVVGTGGDAIAALYRVLEPYRAGVLAWSKEDWFPVVTDRDMSGGMGWGRDARKAYPGLREIVDPIPFQIGAVLPTASSLDVLFKPPGETTPLPYVWPEEANAARIARRLANELHLETPSFPPRLVALLRDCRALYAFFVDVAEGRLTLQAGSVTLQRTTPFPVAELPKGSTARTLALLAEAARQTVTDGVALNGAAIPSPEETPLLTPDDLATKVGQWVTETDADWPVWRFAIMGVALEEQARSQER
ncbi:MAG: VWA domain-containing protein [Alphaproteobacteria bacterium]